MIPRLVGWPGWRPWSFPVHSGRSPSRSVPSWATFSKCAACSLSRTTTSRYRTRGRTRWAERAGRSPLRPGGRPWSRKVVPNEKGLLCAHYPLELLVLERERASPRSVGRQCLLFSCAFCLPGGPLTPLTAPLPASPRRVNTVDVLGPAMAAGRFARTRSRFVVPVLLVGETNICRSATLARSMEIKTREAHRAVNQAVAAMFFPGPAADADDAAFSAAAFPAPPPSGPPSPDAAATVAPPPSPAPPLLPGDDPSSVTARHRAADVALLRALRVRTVCDLMVETRKVKLGLAVTSSEKADRRGRYAAFDIAAVPCVWARRRRT